MGRAVFASQSRLSEMRMSEMRRTTADSPLLNANVIAPVVGTSAAKYAPAFSIVPAAASGTQSAPLSAKQYSERSIAAFVALTTSSQSGDSSSATSLITSVISGALGLS